MMIGTSVGHLRQEGFEDSHLYQMQVTDAATPVLTRLLRLPDTDLLTGTAPILAEPFSQGAAQLYAERFRTAQSDYNMLIAKGFGLSVLGAAVATGACMAAAPLLGVTAMVVNGAACVAIPLIYAHAVLRERVALCGLGAAMLLSEASESLDHVPASVRMADHCAEQALEAVTAAHVFGLVDERLLPAVRQYVARYNDKFGEEFEVV